MIYLEETIMELWHTTPQGGHLGMDASIRRLQSLFHWDSLIQKTKDFVNKCDICQRNKYDVAAFFGSLQPLHVPEGV